jgi:hypothetical protein
MLSKLRKSPDIGFERAYSDALETGAKSACGGQGRPRSPSRPNLKAAEPASPFRSFKGEAESCVLDTFRQKRIIWERGTINDLTRAGIDPGRVARGDFDAEPIDYSSFRL